MYGLFLNTYDYYELNDLVCVSSSKEKLRECKPKDYPLLHGKRQEEAKEDEAIHYVIEEIDSV